MSESAVFTSVAAGRFALIAEAGVNYHEIAGKLGVTPLRAALMMIEEAAAAGITTVKFQTYKAGGLAVRNSPAYWDRNAEPTATQYELFAKYDAFGEQEYGELAARCAELGVEFLSTPFDFESADYLDPLMAAFKISSSDVTNLPFIAHIAKKDKPVILSCGASNADELRQAVDAIRLYNDRPLILMHCVLQYPTDYENANLRKIAALRQAFPDASVGYSDHTVPQASHDVVKAAYCLGAMAVEKHFTLDKTLPGNDHYHAMDPDDARAILSGVSFIERVLGKGDLDCLGCEESARLHARRSVVTRRRLPRGHVVRLEDLTYKRPGGGISPAAAENLVGRLTLREIDEDVAIRWDMVE